MKIGLSFSRCVRDIVEGNVNMNDVLVVIARTDFDPTKDEQWSGIWKGYAGGSFYNMNMEWGGYDVDNPEHEKLFRDATLELYNWGKLHQPRQFGAHATRLPYHWLETVLPSDELDKNPMIKDAWEKFQVVAGLSNISLEDKHR